MQGEAAIVGVGESIYYRAGRSPHDAFQLACIAICNSIADAGLGTETGEGTDFIVITR